MTTGRINQVCALQVGSKPSAARESSAWGTAVPPKEQSLANLFKAKSNNRVHASMTLLHLIAAYTGHVVVSLNTTSRSQGPSPTPTLMHSASHASQFHNNAQQVPNTPSHQPDQPDTNSRSHAESRVPNRQPRQLHAQLGGMKGPAKRLRASGTEPSSPPIV